MTYITIVNSYFVGAHSTNSISFYFTFFFCAYVCVPVKGSPEGGCLCGKVETAAAGTNTITRTRENEGGREVKVGVQEGRRMETCPVELTPGFSMDTVVRGEKSERKGK